MGLTKTRSATPITAFIVVVALSVARRAAVAQSLAPSAAPTEGCDCIKNRIGDSFCDRQNNNECCFWDGGDCCEESCGATDYYNGCGYEDYVEVGFRNCSDPIYAVPSLEPSRGPTETPIDDPSQAPTRTPSRIPSPLITKSPSASTKAPSASTKAPSTIPTELPSTSPTLCHNPGHFTAQNGSCVDCLPGTYDDLGNSTESARPQESCAECPAGNMCPNSGSFEAIPCPPGYFQSASGRTSCERCPPNAYCSEGSIEPGLCPVHFYLKEELREKLLEDGSDQTELAKSCLKCKTGMICEEVGVALASLVLKEGYTRSSPSSDEIIECANAEACPGGLQSESCGNGYEGPRCGVCEDRYFPNRLEGTYFCEDCDSDFAKVVGVWTAVLAFFGILASCLCTVIRTNPKDPRSNQKQEIVHDSAGSTWSTSFSSGRRGTSLSVGKAEDSSRPVAETGVSDSMGTSAEWKVAPNARDADEVKERTSPGVAEDEGDEASVALDAQPKEADVREMSFRQWKTTWKIVAGFLQLEHLSVTYYFISAPTSFADFLSVFCVLDLDLFSGVFGTCFLGGFDLVEELVFFLVAPVGLFVFFLMLRCWCFGTKRDVFEYACLLVPFVAMAPAVATAGSAFQCDDLGEEGKFLVADYSIKCNSDEHNAARGLAAAILAVYGGVVAVHGSLLFTKWLENWSIEFLVESYTSESYFFEIVEDIRRLSIAIPPASVTEASTPLLWFGFAVSAVFLIIYCVWMPYVDPLNNGLAIFSQLVLCIVFLYGLAEHFSWVGISNDGGEGIALVVLTFIALAVAVVLPVLRLLYTCSAFNDPGPDNEVDTAPGGETAEESEVKMRVVRRRWSREEAELE